MLSHDFRLIKNNYEKEFVKAIEKAILINATEEMDELVEKIEQVCFSNKKTILGYTFTYQSAYC